MPGSIGKKKEEQIDGREKFLKAYANLPKPERQQIIIIVDKKTYSWNVAYNEITNNTELGKKMIAKMEALGIL